MINPTRLLAVVLILIASVSGMVGQDNEQIYEIRAPRVAMAHNGRAASDVEVEAWMDRIANLRWSDSEECTGIKSDVLGVYRGGKNLGWAEHRHAMVRRIDTRKALH